ncbi:MAG: hypothetical protein ABIV25_13805 [Paracoccaceae bacterium]
MRAPILMLLACGLVACGPTVPESGVGFDNYNSYIHNSTAGISPTQTGAYGAVASAPATQFSTDAAASAITAAEAGTTTAGMTAPTGDPAAQSGERARGNAPAGIQETTSEMNYVTGGVSDEQDFSAVTSRESIASDKARIEANRQQYVVVQPGALPTRTGDAGPNIAEYAIATNNPVGVKLYNRPSFYLTSPQKACGKFTSPDLAQQAFLAAGGPQKDSKALDPDGDGFACDWDPRPFRTALQ